MPAMKSNDILEALTRLKPEIVKRYKVKEIGLFGSFVRHDQADDSDIDIWVDFHEQADLFDWIGLAQWLEIKLNKKVDVVPKNALKEEFREAVMQETRMVI